MKPHQRQWSKRQNREMDDYSDIAEQVRAAYRAGGVDVEAPQHPLGSAFVTVVSPVGRWRAGQGRDVPSAAADALRRAPGWRVGCAKAAATIITDDPDTWPVEGLVAVRYGASGVVVRASDVLDWTEWAGGYWLPMPPMHPKWPWGQ